MSKKVVSAFEFAITEAIDPESAKELRPKTREEENQERADKLRGRLSRMKTVNPETGERKPLIEK